MNYQQSEPPSYRLTSVFRTVQPYSHTYATHSKKRWLGRSLIEVLASQFKAYDRTYYLEAIQKGNITINKQTVTAEYKIKNGDLLEHKALRKQSPVINVPLDIILEEEQFLVVNKPPGIPVHSGGSYHFNSVVGLLFFEKQKKNLWVVHRLDRVTSGVLILAKTKQKANLFHQTNHNHQMQKTYWARVEGRFPQEAEVNKNIIAKSFKEGLYGIAENQDEGKSSLTKFKLLQFDGETSLVECRPVTGRTHQIRIHLMHLGFPILNDTQYGGKFIGNRIIKEHYPQEWQDFNPNNLKQVRPKDWDYEQLEKPLHSSLDLMRAQEICLHAISYQSQLLKIKCPEPYWGLPDWRLNPM